MTLWTKPSLEDKGKCKPTNIFHYLSQTTHSILTDDIQINYYSSPNVMLVEDPSLFPIKKGKTSLNTAHLLMVPAN